MYLHFRLEWVNNFNLHIIYYLFLHGIKCVYAEIFSTIQWVLIGNISSMILVQFLATDSVVKGEGLYMLYPLIIVKEIRDFDFRAKPGQVASILQRQLPF